MADRILSDSLYQQVVEALDDCIGIGPQNDAKRAAALASLQSLPVAGGEPTAIPRFHWNQDTSHTFTFGYMAGPVPDGEWVRYADVAALSSGEPKETHPDRLAAALEEFDHRLTQWAGAYPDSVFPEPDFDKVKTLLGDNLLTRVSASNMRHVVTKLNELYEPVRAALKATDSDRSLNGEPQP